MAKKKAGKSYHWRCRTTEGERLLSLWLIVADGAARYAITYGCVDREAADELKAATNFPWEEDAVVAGPLAGEPRPRPCVQPELFP